MNRPESQHPEQSWHQTPSQSQRDAESGRSQAPDGRKMGPVGSMLSAIYWQVLVALFGFVASLGLQIWLGLPLLVDTLCGNAESFIESQRCAETAFRSSFLISLAATSSLGVAIGAAIVAKFRRLRGSFLFAWAVSYLFFAFLASLREGFFLDLLEGSAGQNIAYVLAGVAVGGGLVAALAYHVPRWVLGWKDKNSHSIHIRETGQQI